MEATIELAKTVEALRGELSELIAKAAGRDIQFPVGPVQLEFQVGAKKDVDAKAGVKFYVVELGGGGSYSTQSIQKVTITLEPPVNSMGERVRVTQVSDQRP